MQHIIDKAYEDGTINSYTAQRLQNAMSFGMDEQLLNDALVDAKETSNYNIDNDKHYNLKFILFTLAEGVLESISDNQKLNLYDYALKFCDTLETVEDYLDLIEQWAKQYKYKKAHPNIQGKFDRGVQYDVNKWKQSAQQLYNIRNVNNIPRHEALNIITQNWDADEKYKFDHWLSYYESENAEKYNVKTADINKNALDLNIPNSLLDPSFRSNRLPDVLERTKNKEQEAVDKKQQNLEFAKHLRKKLKSRLRSCRKLLDEYLDTMPSNDVEKILDEMYALDKSVNKLNIFASIQDRIILSANRLQKVGFSNGSDILMKLAQEPQAVESKPEEAPNYEEVVKSIPPPLESPYPQLTTPSDIVNIKTVIHRLEGVSKRLKSRDTIRELASIDILLNELGMASLFPELTDAQSKLIESYGYASNKVESIVAKLRGIGSDSRKPVSVKPAIKPAPISTEQLKNKPIGEVKKQLPG